MNGWKVYQEPIYVSDRCIKIQIVSTSKYLWFHFMFGAQCNDTGVWRGFSPVKYTSYPKSW